MADLESSSQGEQAMRERVRSLLTTAGAEIPGRSFGRVPEDRKIVE